MVDNAWSARLVSGVTMHGMLDEVAQRGRPGINVMRQVLAKRGPDYVPPASNLEARFDKVLTDGGLPPMRRQVNVGDSTMDRPSRLPGRGAAAHRRGAERAVPLEPHRPAARCDRIDRLERAGFVVVELTDVEVWHTAGARCSPRCGPAAREAAARHVLPGESPPPAATWVRTFPLAANFAPRLRASANPGANLPANARTSDPGCGGGWVGGQGVRDVGVHVAFDDLDVEAAFDAFGGGGVDVDRLVVAEDDRHLGLAVSARPKTMVWSPIGDVLRLESQVPLGCLWTSSS